MGHGRKSNCDGCHSEVFLRRLSRIPEYHYLKQSTDWQLLCTKCCIEYNVPLNESRKQSRIRRGTELPLVDAPSISPIGKDGEG